MSPPIQLSPEQEAILATAEAPRQSSEQRIVRVTAAAGTGKTTTLLHLAERCASLGHTQIAYITFNRAAAADGKARLEQALRRLNGRVHLQAQTLHACAMRCLANAREQDYNEDQVEDALLSDNALQALIKEQLQQEIAAFLAPCFANIDSRSSHTAQKKAAKIAAEKQVCFFLYKTLAQFCHGHLKREDLKNPHFSEIDRNYYPAKLFHEHNGKGEKLGFPSSVYSSQLGWYPAQAYKLFFHLLTRVRTYDLEMKRAQLKQLEIPGTVLLVDECQDMDGCQVNWIANQKAHSVNGSSKLIYLVGDAAQTIYGFRGAKSKFVMAISPVVERSLTTSWRFGPSIAKMANLVLFAKEKSPQTKPAKGKSPQTKSGGSSTWTPYRVTGGATAPCRVTADPIDWRRHGKVTLIAWQNVTLFMAAIELLGGPLSQEEEFDDPEVSRSPVGDTSLSQESATSLAMVTPSPEKMRDADDDASSHSRTAPRFHINGKGESSGLGKWKQFMTQIEFLYDLYQSETSMTLPRKYFPELAEESITWETFLEYSNTRELTRYAATVRVITVYGDNTKEVVKQFQEEIMNKAYSAEEADIILTTCHSAKGMEWDNVQVCDDFTKEILQVKKTVDLKKWEFDIKNWGDDVNLLYVACTRAKKLLSIPAPLRILLEEFDAIAARVRGDQGKEPARKKLRFESVDDSIEDEDAPGLKCRKKRLNEQQSKEVFDSLIKAFRLEAGIEDDQTCVGELLSDLTSAGVAK